MFAAILDSAGRPLSAHDVPARWRAVRFGQPQSDVLLIGGRSAQIGKDAHVFVKGDPGLRLVGRVRLDGREALRRHLGRTAIDGLDSDASLCLAAYARWGTGFLDRLAGDFCFVLWDGVERRLIGARDQLGVRALFYGRAGDRWYVSDRLEAVAAVPGLATGLDETWIADFLCRGVCGDPERTVWRDIVRLPAAHRLVLSGGGSGGGSGARRYWTLDPGGPSPLGVHDAAERFRALLGEAIADRLPAGPVGISLSGGLDSTTLAACAVAVTKDPARFVAECTHFERLMKDDEPVYAACAADHLGIALHHRAIDDLTYDPDWRALPACLPEPSRAALALRWTAEVCREFAVRAPVWLYGEGPVNALAFDRDPYLRWLLACRDVTGLARAVARYVVVKGGAGWSASLRRALSPRPPSLDGAPDIPDWLSPDLARHADAASQRREAEQVSPHPWHPTAMASFAGPLWPQFFAESDIEECLAPFEWRHPYLDLRVLSFLLSLPPIPFGWRKRLLRVAMRDRLPPEILARPKTPLSGSPVVQPIRAHGLGTLSRQSGVEAFVRVDRLPQRVDEPELLERLIRVHVLDHWLASLVAGGGGSAGPAGPR